MHMHLDKGVCEYKHTTNIIRMTRGWFAVGWLRYVGLDEMVHAMMNEFFSPSSFRRRMAARPSLPPRLFPSSPPSLPSLRKRLRQKQSPARRKRERGREERLFSTRKERGRYRSSAAADADDGEGRREREGGQWCVSHAACARPPSFSSSPTGRGRGVLSK